MWLEILSYADQRDEAKARSLFPKQSFFLMGPRGSGKSTWLRSTFPDAHVIDLLSGKNFNEVWCKGLRAVAELKGLQRRIIVYPNGAVLRTKDGIDVVPFHHFADQLAGNSLWI